MNKNELAEQKMALIPIDEYRRLLQEADTWLTTIDCQTSEIEEKRVLCARAADALEEDQPLVREPVGSDFWPDRKALIDALRKAAE